MAESSARAPGARVLRARVALWRRAADLLALAPRELKSSRQVAREALRRGALQKTRELGPLLQLLRERRPRVVVEIGTANGGTLYALCQVADDDALLVSIDLPGGEFGGGYREDALPRLRSYARGGQALHFLRRDSHAPSTRDELQEILAGRAVDFLLIDGDHTYDGVRADFEMYAPLVAAGGLVALHDVLPHPQVPACEVDRFWSELRQRFEHEEFLEPAHDMGWGQWGGIGVVRVPGGA